jgi:hypothetical protein
MGHVTRITKKKSAYKDLVGKNLKVRLCGSLRRRWEDTIKMDLKK